MTTKPKADVVRLERTISATPHQVYLAWLQPETLRLWLAPGGLEVSQAEVEPRVGGRFRIWQSDYGTDVGGFDCEILELVPDERIVFRWGFVGPERRAGPAFDSRLTVTLKPGSKQSTILTLLHEQLDDLAVAMPEVAGNVGIGWKIVLEKLAAQVGEE